MSLRTAKWKGLQSSLTEKAVKTEASKAMVVLSQDVILVKITSVVLG